MNGHATHTARPTAARIALVHHLVYHVPDRGRLSLACRHLEGYAQLLDDGRRILSHFMLVEKPGILFRVGGDDMIADPVGFHYYSVPPFGLPALYTPRQGCRDGTRLDSPGTIPYSASIPARKSRKVHEKGYAIAWSTSAHSAHPTVKNPRGLLVVIVLAGLFFAFWRTTGLVADWLWFQEVGYENCLHRQPVRADEGGRLLRHPVLPLLLPEPLYCKPPGAEIPGARGKRHHRPEPPGPGEVALSAFDPGRSLSSSGLLAALAGASQWENLLLYFNGVPFGADDPLFGKDIGFYVFQLPFSTTSSGGS